MEFHLRPWKPVDLESLVKHANNISIAKNMTDQFPHPYTEESGKRFIEMTLQSRPANIFAIVVNNQAVGGIGIHPQQDIYKLNAELGYWLSEAFWGNGIVTNAVKRMIDYAFENWEIKRIFARPFSTNEASQRVLQKAGFKLEATLEKTIFKNGEILDELIYAIRRN